MSLSAGCARSAFTGPYRGARHEFLVLGERRQTVPLNIGYLVPQLKMLLRQIEAVLGRRISGEEWDAL